MNARNKKRQGGWISVLQCIAYVAPRICVCIQTLFGYLLTMSDPSNTTLAWELSSVSNFPAWDRCEWSNQTYTK